MSVALIVAALSLPAGVPALAAGASATIYRSGAYYRALLLRRPPAYWTGGTMFVPLAPLLQPAVLEAGRPKLYRMPTRPITLRVPDEYLAAALAEPHPSPMWVKTVRGFRLEP